MRPFRTKILAAIPAVAILSGCSASFERLPADATFDPPAHQSVYEAAIRTYFDNNLKDPESARYRFYPAKKAYGNNGLIYGGGVTWKGYVVRTDVNAKNSFGGYVGYQSHLVLFSSGSSTIHRVIEGEKHPLVTVLESQ